MQSRRANLQRAQVNDIGFARTAREISDAVLQRSRSRITPIKDESVAARASRQCVGSAATHDAVVGTAAEEDVIPDRSNQCVCPGCSIDLVCNLRIRGHSYARVPRIVPEE